MTDSLLLKLNGNKSFLICFFLFFCKYVSANIKAIWYKDFCYIFCVRHFGTSVSWCNDTKTSACRVASFFACVLNVFKCRFIRPNCQRGKQKFCPSFNCWKSWIFLVIFFWLCIFYLWKYVVANEFVYSCISISRYSYYLRFKPGGQFRTRFCTKIFCNLENSCTFIGM